MGMTLASNINPFHGNACQQHGHPTTLMQYTQLVRPTCASCSIMDSRLAPLPPITHRAQVAASILQLQSLVEEGVGVDA